MLESNKAYKAFINSNNGTFQTVVNKWLFSKMLKQNGDVN
jgi:hypothetical protein